MQANVPGIAKGDISVEIEDGTLTLKFDNADANAAAADGGTPADAGVDKGGKSGAAAGDEAGVATGVPVSGVEEGGDEGAAGGEGGVKWHLRERGAELCAREIELPECANTENVAAACADGVLTIVFGKKAAASNVKRIKVA